MGMGAAAKAVRETAPGRKQRNKREAIVQTAQSLATFIACIPCLLTLVFV
jgi:hypothetical protein